MISLNRLVQFIVTPSANIIGWLAGMRAATFQTSTNILTDAASLVTDCSLGDVQSITCANDNVRVFALPTNLKTGSIFITEVINTSGAPLTNTTWAAGYLPVNPTLPATANRRDQMWRWDGTKAHLIVQSAADVAN
jgi:hypothetical protein